MAFALGSAIGNTFGALKHGIFGHKNEIDINSHKKLEMAKRVNIGMNDTRNTMPTPTPPIPSVGSVGLSGMGGP